MPYFWAVEEKKVEVREGANLADLGLYNEDGTPVQDKGHRYRYLCTCGHAGRWLRDPNLADGQEHLARKHELYG
jgi:hypothetical protein